MYASPRVSKGALPLVLVVYMLRLRRGGWPQSYQRDRQLAASLHPSLIQRYAITSLSPLAKFTDAHHLHRHLSDQMSSGTTPLNNVVILLPGWAAKPSDPENTWDSVREYLNAERVSFFVPHLYHRFGSIDERGESAIGEISETFSGCGVHFIGHSLVRRLWSLATIPAHSLTRTTHKGGTGGSFHRFPQRPSVHCVHGHHTRKD